MSSHFLESTSILFHPDDCLALSLRWSNFIIHFLCKLSRHSNTHTHIQIHYITQQRKKPESKIHLKTTHIYGSDSRPRVLAKDSDKSSSPSDQNPAQQLHDHYGAIKNPLSLARRWMQNFRGLGTAGKTDEETRELMCGRAHPGKS